MYQHQMRQMQNIHITCSLASSNCWSFARIDRSLSSIKSSILSCHTTTASWVVLCHPEYKHL